MNSVNLSSVKSPLRLVVKLSKVKTSKNTNESFVAQEKVKTAKRAIYMYSDDR